MVEVRFHGRGGQGAVTSAELLAQAAVAEGRYAQAFPSFGPERRGAPLQAFLRISTSPIRLREKIYTPDIVVVLDPALVATGGVAQGLKDSGVLIANTTKSVAEVKQLTGFKGRTAVVDATAIAEEELGVPITNTTMLGALLKAEALVGMEALGKALEGRFGKLAERNMKALKRAYEATVIEE